MVLPVSRIEVSYHAPDGNDDLALLESSGSVIEQALLGLSRLSSMKPQGEPPARAASWHELTVTDFEVALLGLRSYLFGDLMSCIFRAVGHNSGEPLELEFSIQSVLEGIKADMPPQVQRDEAQAGWYEFSGSRESQTRFRLPSVRDQVEVVGHRKAIELLTERCIQTTRLRAGILARIERAMDAMAPAVSRTIAGNCPRCGEPISMMFQVPRILMDELKMAATGVHGEIDLIAGSYHWDEAAILAMPQARRRAYASSIRQRSREMSR